jgi:hypothetical protein
MRFISCSDSLPVKPGQFSEEKFLIRVLEFGMEHPVYVLANCWISSGFPLLPKWYIGNDPPMAIAETVTHWMKIIEPERSGNDRL